MRFIDMRFIYYVKSWYVFDANMLMLFIIKGDYIYFGYLLLHVIVPAPSTELV